MRLYRGPSAVRRFERRAGLASVVPRAGVASCPRAPNVDDALYTATRLRVTVRRQHVLHHRRPIFKLNASKWFRRLSMCFDEDLSGHTKRRCGSASRCDRAPARRQVHVDRDVWEKMCSIPLQQSRFESKPATRIISWSSLFDMCHRDSRRTRRFERFHRVEGARSRTHEGSGVGLAS